MQHKGKIMFEALVLVCFIDQSCVELHNNRGLYRTEQACKARTVEMISDFVSDSDTPPVITIQYKCIKQQGQSI